MADWRCVASTSEVHPDRINQANLGNLKLILLAVDGNILAYADACPHEGHPLSLGELEADVLICAKHFWEFEIRTGRHISRVHRPQCNLKRFAVRLVGERIEVDVSATAESADDKEG